MSSSDSSFEDDFLNLTCFKENPADDISSSQYYEDTTTGICNNKPNKRNKL